MVDRKRKGAGTSAITQKKVPPPRRVKKSKARSVVVLVLSGSTAPRRRKSAETLAETLNVDLFRVDLSAVVGQYIGETEKNLNNVFDTAEASGAVLFFDEVDVLFGAGRKADDADRRFANTETAHFLQRVECHNGIVILTTDGKQPIQQAFSPQAPVVVMVGTAGIGRVKKKSAQVSPARKVG